MQEFGTLQYLMNYFTSLTFYIWRHVQYCTIRTVTIITQSQYIVRFVTSIVNLPSARYFEFEKSN